MNLTHEDNKNNASEEENTNINKNNIRMNKTNSEDDRQK